MAEAKPFLDMLLDVSGLNADRRKRPTPNEQVEEGFEAMEEGERKKRRPAPPRRPQTRLGDVEPY